MLQDNGHEIAYHTRTHPRLGPYLQTHWLDHWLQKEIDLGMSEYRALGFPATAFPCPFHASTPDTRAALSEQFYVSRTGGPRSLDTNKPETRIYHKLPKDKSVANIGFADSQHNAFPGWTRQLALIDLVSRNDGFAVLNGDDIGPSKQGTGLYSSPSQLKRILKRAVHNDMVF